MSDEPAVPPAPLPPGPARKRVLLVEDDPALAEITKWLLTRDGLEVLHAADGMAALDLIRRERPNLILSDVMLPKMDGYKLCRLVKFDADLRAIPFVFLTARTQDKDRETAMAAGADAYFTKPMKNDALLLMVRKHLA